MKLWHAVSGSLRIRLIYADQRALLRQISGLGIELRDLQWENELECVALLSRRDWQRLKGKLSRFGCRAVPVQRQGLYWWARDLSKHKIWILTVLILLAGSLWLPTRILFIQVNGNAAVPAKQILEAAEESGLFFGVSRRSLRSERIKNGLLQKIPALSWAGINTSGCVAEISVRERSVNLKTEEKVGVQHIVASHDGYILSETVLRGAAQFQPGQTVRKGEILISGYTDGGICIQGSAAEGEVWAQTNREFCAVTPQNLVRRVRARGIRRRYSLIFRKIRINLWKDSGISPVTCGRMYEEYYVTLPGGLVLPFALGIDTETFYDTHFADVEEAEAAAGLRSFSGEYLTGQMAAGSIRSASEQVEANAGTWVLQGRYVCEEMISRQQPEQIGVTNGKER